MSKYPELYTAMKEGARGASLMDGKQATQQLLTDSETGSDLEKLDGKSQTSTSLFKRHVRTTTPAYAGVDY